MKKIFILLFVICTLSVSAQRMSKILDRSEGSITFVVDSGLPAPTKPLETFNSALVTTGLLYEMGGIDRDYSDVVVRSFEDKKLALCMPDAFFRMMIRAYADHRPIELCPDDIWLLISQGVARHINLNAEKLRSKLVNHEEKIQLYVETSQALLGENDTLVLPRQDKPVDWPAIFDGFVMQMKEHSKGDITEILPADFSTTTIESRIASQITLMNAMQPFFDYVVVRFSCGTPYIILKGTPEDWQKIIDNVKKLKKYDLSWWIEKLIPVLEHFLLASMGEVDTQFWRCMIAQIAPDKLRGGGCSMEVPTKFDGWFLNFFPYDKKGRTPSLVTQEHRMLNEVVNADFVYRLIGSYGNTIKETPMQFWAGFVGVEEDPETYVVKPHIGWFVRKNIHKVGKE